MKVLLQIWWRFFWRYAVLFWAFLLFGGMILNATVWFFPDMTVLYLITLFYSGLINVLASAIIFFYILNRQFKNSALVLSLTCCNISFKEKLQIWFQYYWRFLLFSVSLSLLLGALLPLAARLLGYEPTSALKYSKYIGNFSIIPASFLAFWLFLRRGKRKGILHINNYI